MAESEEPEIEILRVDTRKFETRRAVLSQNASCNIIERTCLEGLKRSWSRADNGIIYDFSDYASPPLGWCELNWKWKGCSASAWATFVVVEKIEGSTCGIMLGPSGRQKPVIRTSNDVLTFALRNRANGTNSCFLFA